MAIYLYCVLRATREPPAELRGIDGLPVRAVDLGGLGAWVSDIGAVPIVASAERARGHDRVVRAALDGDTPLPARFGQVVASDADLRATVASVRDALEAALRLVQGTVEMTVRMLIPREDGEPAEVKGSAEGDHARTGRDYLERVAAIQREERNVLAKAEVVRNRITTAVAGLTRAESFVGAAAGSRLATLSHLVPRENVDAYRRALLALRRDDAALAFMVSGPWAPYSFTEGLRR